MCVCVTIILMLLPQCADRTAIIIYTYQNIDTDGEGGDPIGERPERGRGVGDRGLGIGNWGLKTGD